MIRLILILLLSLFAYRFVKRTVRKKTRDRTEVKGKADSNPLDLEDYEISDAHYEDIDDGTQK